MREEGKILSKKIIPVIAITGIILFIGGVLFLSDIKVVVHKISEYYLLLSEKLSLLLLHRWGLTGVTVHEGSVFLNGRELTGFIPETLFKKWDLALLVFIWITRAPVRRKILWSLYLFLISFILIVFHNASGIYFLVKGFNVDIFYAVSLTFGMFVLITLGYLWYLLNRGRILEGKIAGRIGRDFLKRKIPMIFLVIYLYVLLQSFVLPVFEFGPWINFLFTTSAKILRFLGYYVKVEPFYLIGENGTIYMSKGCLGFKTMLLFASIVYITGESFRKRFIYITGGLIFLNIVNIIRFVLLFMHVQKYGGYQLAIDLHELYKYVTYTLVFIMWLVWFERYSDLRNNRRS